jgi:P27 family predicted phage terminase small subunit
VSQLRAIGVLTTIDGKALAVYCEVHARLLIAREHIAKYGNVIGEGEHIKKNPSVLIAEKCEMTLRAYLIEFGLTPASRARLEVGVPTEQPDEFESWLASEPL